MERLLDDAKRMVLAWNGATGPVTAPMAFWSDGRHLWCTTAGSAGKVAALERDPSCVVWVAEEDGPGLVVRGRARIFRPTDVVAMATHGAVLAAAQAALAIKQLPSLAGYVVDAAKVPAMWAPARRVTLRITIDDRVPVDPPPLGPGIAPALPTVVPPEVRRLLSGARRVVVATRTDGGLGVLPAVWQPGFALELPDGARIADGTAVSMVVDHDPGFRPTDVAGVELRGTYRAGSVKPARIRWWWGFDSGSADMPASPVDPIVIPD